MELANTTNFINETRLSDNGSMLEMFAYTFVAVMSFLCNGTVIFCASGIQKRTFGTKVCINIAASNLMSALLLLPLQAQGDVWVFNQQLCLFILVTSTLWRISILLSTLLAVFQCHRIKCHHYHKGIATSNHGNGKFVVIWLSTGALGIFAFLCISYHFLFKEPAPICTVYQYSYQGLVQLFFGSVALLFIFMLIINARHRKMSRKQITVISQQELCSAEDFSKCAFHLFHVLLFLWSPYIFYLLVLSLWDVKEIHYEGTSYKVLKTFQLMSYASTLLQPLVSLRFNAQISTRLCNIPFVRKCCEFVTYMWLKKRMMVPRGFGVVASEEVQSNTDAV